MSIAKTAINDDSLPLGRSSESMVAFGDSDIAVTSENTLLLARAARRMVSLAKNQGVRWSNDGAHNLKAEILGLNFIISTSEDVFILNEVFGEKIYALVNCGPVHFVDIGANIGIASLSFAIQSWVSRVTGFEPLKPTYEMAQKHLAINSHVADKVKLYNFGLAGSDREAVVEYSLSWKGSVGIRTAPIIRNAPDRREEQIRLRKASSVLQELRIGRQNERVFVKMDCEGAEYEIVEDLVKSRAIEGIAAFMIEWHDFGPETLSRPLLESGFTVWHGGEGMDRTIGLIYAIRGSVT